MWVINLFNLFQMGINVSKPGHTYKDHEPDQGSLPSTPILTPKNKDFAEFDPRSPSANIVRTPIQVSNSFKHVYKRILLNQQYKYVFLVYSF